MERKREETNRYKKGGEGEQANRNPQYTCLYFIIDLFTFHV
jgi:hypothetical protein